MDLKEENMLVKEILTNVAYLLDDNKLIEAISQDNFTGHLLEDKNLLIKCVNYVNNIIATEYFHIDETVTIDNSNGLIPYTSITQKTIFDIVEIKGAFGKKINFKTTTNGIETKKGKLTVKFLYMPEDVAYDDNITCYPTKINARIFAYGVASEYLFIKGNFDEGDIWDNRFKNALKSIQRNHKEIIMPNRRWQ